MTDDDVRFVYRELLDREPESQDTIESWKAIGWRDFLSVVLYSDERRNAIFGDMVRRTNLGTTIYIPTRYGFLMPVSPMDPDMYRVYKDSCYEAAESEFINSHTLPGDYCIDLGSRHGWFTGIMAARAGADGRVFSFDPFPPPAGAREVAAVNRFTWVTQFNVAASDRKGTVSFDAAALTMAGGGAAQVQTCTLDELLATRERPIRVMKIDIEGAEHLALSGARTILTIDKPIIMMELFDRLLRQVGGIGGAELVDSLRTHSYAPYTLGGEPLERSAMSERLAGGEIMNVALWPDGHPRHP